MIKNVAITNYLNETLVFDLRSPALSGFFVKSIDGLGPPKATINMTEALSLDGSMFNSARTNNRNVVLKIGYLENPSIEETRRRSYQFFPLKKYLTIVIETDLRFYKTYGYVESNEPDIFSNDSGATVSIVCPNPYFYSLESQIVDFNHIIDLFQFPFSNESLINKLIIFSNLETDLETNVYYSGDAPIGITMNIHIVGPVEDLQIINNRTRETMIIDHDILVALTGSGLHSGDNIRIVTIKGQKEVILTRDGEDINILNALGPGSIWFTLERGDNIFLYTASLGVINVVFTIEYNLLYEGI
jgi:hypothetical protein